MSTPVGASLVPNIVGARRGGVDLLTRTTLHFQEATPALSLVSLTRALHAVPGVLLAEVNAATARAIVAHDEGVAAATILAAAVRVGVHAKIVDDRPALTLDAVADPVRAYRHLGRLFGIVVTASCCLTIVEVAAPKFAHWLVPAYAISLGVFIFLCSLSRRTRS